MNNNQIRAGIALWPAIRSLAFEYGCEVHEGKGWLERTFTFTGPNTPKLIEHLKRAANHPEAEGTS